MEDSTRRFTARSCSATSRNLLPSRCLLSMWRDRNRSSSVPPLSIHQTCMELSTTFEQSLPGLLSLVCLPPSRISIPIFPWILWSIWLARNAMIFELTNICPADIVCKALRLAKEWIEAQPSKAMSPTHTYTQRQSVPNTIVCCTDAAWRNQDKRAGCGWVFKKRQEALWNMDHTLNLLLLPRSWQRRSLFERLWCMPSLSSSPKSASSQIIKCSIMHCSRRKSQWKSTESIWTSSLYPLFLTLSSLCLFPEP